MDSGDFEKIMVKTPMSTLKKKLKPPQCRSGSIAKKLGTHVYNSHFLADHRLEPPPPTMD